MSNVWRWWCRLRYHNFFNCKCGCRSWCRRCCRRFASSSCSIALLLVIIVAQINHHIRHRLSRRAHCRFRYSLISSIANRQRPVDQHKRIDNVLPERVQTPCTRNLCVHPLLVLAVVVVVECAARAHKQPHVPVQLMALPGVAVRRHGEVVVEQRLDVALLDVAQQHKRLRLPGALVNGDERR